MPKCDPVPRSAELMTIRVSSIGDPDWGMYVTPDDPLRDTPEKARVYYERTFAVLARTSDRVMVKSMDDIDALMRVLGDQRHGSGVVLDASGISVQNGKLDIGNA